MKRFTTVAILSVLVFSGISFASFIPSWAGAPTSTYQAWTFDDNSTFIAAPDNGFGVPTAEVRIISPTVPAYQGGLGLGKWLNYDQGHQGVWRLFGPDGIILDIPNDPTDRPIKEIFVTVTYSADGALESETEPGIAEMPLTVEHEDLGNSYVRDTFMFVLSPNPASEQIVIFPRDCRLYVDEIEVWTNCIPEPATMGLLGLGALVIFRKRK